jgi:hypothetical protein
MTPGFCHGRGDEFRSLGLLGGALVEKIAISAHAAKAAFINGAAMA